MVEADTTCKTTNYSYHRNYEHIIGEEKETWEKSRREEKISFKTMNTTRVINTKFLIIIIMSKIQVLWDVMLCRWTKLQGTVKRTKNLD
jgi:hypothetical protein